MVSITEHLLTSLTFTSNGTDLGDYESSLGFWKRRSAVIFTTGSTNEGSFEPWVALSTGGTFPLDEVNNFSFGGANNLVIPVDARSVVSEIQLYPNPTEGQTTLAYTLEEETDVTIYLRDVTGRVVRNIFTGRLGAGTHNSVEDFSSLPTGLYFYNMNMGGRIMNYKLLVQ